MEKGTSTTLAPDGPDFTNTEYDHPGPKPPWGVAGYTKDGKNVIVEDKYDLWTLPLDGKGAARNITNGMGAENRITFRLVRTGAHGPHGEPPDANGPGVRSVAARDPLGLR